MLRKHSARQKMSVVEVWGKPFLIGEINFNYARWFGQSTKLVFWRAEFFYAFLMHVMHIKNNP